MRVLLVTEDVPVQHLGGAGRHAVTLGNALIEAGHSVDLLGLADRNAMALDNGFAGRLHRRIGFRRTGWQEHRFGTFLPYRRHHIGHRIAAAIRSVGLSKYDVVHYHGHVVETGLFIPRSLNYVHTLHDQGSECLRFVRFVNGDRCFETRAAACVQCASGNPGIVQTWLTARAVERHRSAADEVFHQHKAIFVSEFLRQRFIANTGSDGRFNSRVIHNFIGPQAALPAATVSPTPARVLLSGRVDVYKGFIELLDLVDDELLGRFDWRLAGDGPQMPRLRERHGHRRLELLGFLDQQELMEETACAALTLVPSICDEACATSILEALGYGVPVWALARGGSPELLRYQAYAGQMRVFESLTDMVAALRTFTPSPRTAHSNPDVTVQARLPEILDYYGQ